MEEILALNTRSEIMFHAGNKDIPHECTSLTLLPDRSATGTTLLAQNWDWLLHSMDTAMLLEVTRDDGPSFVTLVEAGLLAKVGMNAAGVGLCTNTLVSDGDEGRIGVPYHVLLRSGPRQRVRPRGRPDDHRGRARPVGQLPDRRRHRLRRRPRDGPRADGVRVLTPVDGQITHSNHFRSTDLTGEDLYARRKPHTLTRLRNVTESLSERPSLSVDDLKKVLADHQDSPSSVCQHPNEAVHERERTATIAGVIMDVSNRTMHLAAGRPCVARWETRTLAPR